MVACSSTDDTPASPATSDPATEPATSAPATSAPASPSEAPTDQAAQANQALLAAGRLALKEVPDSTVVSIETERGGWEVHVVTADGGEQQLLTDSSGEKLVSGPTDERPDADDVAENKAFAKVEVDFEQAVKAIEGEIPDGKINELSLDQERRRIVWEADVASGTEQRAVQVDASSGEVVSNRRDD